jgi:homoserine O-succinyltransferase/O-acetyltransferase
MPVLLDRGRSGHSFFSEVQSLNGRSRPESREAGSNRIDLALVNNMPDSALESTERQFLELLDAAAEDTLIHLKLFALPDVPRSEWGQGYLRSSYSDIGDLWDGQFDGLIVTGTEPRAPVLTDEPYWPALKKLLDWAEDNTVSTIWSCLAAHAAVLHLDGIARRALGEKRFGVFEFANVSGHPMTKDAPPRWHIPHSRFNDLPESALVSCGYHVLTRSAEAGVDMFVKRRKSLFVFFQGHPEYEPGTLLREYRRDTGRFLRRERETYPAMPQGYFDERSADLLAAFREQALSDRREELLASFPTAFVEHTLANSWRQPATRIYRSWLSHVSTQKARKPASAAYRALPRSQTVRPSNSRESGDASAG